MKSGERILSVLESEVIKHLVVRCGKKYLHPDKDVISLGAIIAFYTGKKQSNVNNFQKGLYCSNRGESFQE